MAAAAYCLQHPDSFYLDVLDKADISDQTKRSYRFSLQRIQQVLPDKRICDILMHPGSSFAALEGAIPNRASLKTTVSSLLAIMKYAHIKKDQPKVFGDWYVLFGPLATEVTQARESNEPTERQTKAMVDWGQVQKTMDELAKTQPASRTHLLLSMYTLLAPRRQEDYYQVYIIRDPKEAQGDKSALPAYIDMTAQAPFLCVQEFKTAKALQAWKKEVPPRLLAIIQKSLEKEPRDYLFTQADGNRFGNANSFTQFNNRTLKKLFGPDVSLNSLRHAYATKLLDDNLSLWEHKQVAKDMGHSALTNMSYAFKRARSPTGRGKNKEPIEVVKKVEEPTASAPIAPSKPAATLRLDPSQVVYIRQKKQSYVCVPQLRP